MYLPQGARSGAFPSQWCPARWCLAWRLEEVRLPASVESGIRCLVGCAAAICLSAYLGYDAVWNRQGALALRTGLYLRAGTGHVSAVTENQTWWKGTRGQLTLKRGSSAQPSEYWPLTTPSSMRSSMMTSTTAMHLRAYVQRSQRTLQQNRHVHVLFFLLSGSRTVVNSRLPAESSQRCKEEASAGLRCSSTSPWVGHGGVVEDIKGEVQVDGVLLGGTPPVIAISL